jgi:hypothetical protein
MFFQLAVSSLTVSWQRILRVGIPVTPAQASFYRLPHNWLCPLLTTSQYGPRKTNPVIIRYRGNVPLIRRVLVRMIGFINRCLHTHSYTLAIQHHLSLTIYSSQLKRWIHFLRSTELYFCPLISEFIFLLYHFKHLPLARIMLSLLRCGYSSTPSWGFPPHASHVSSGYLQTKAISMGLVCIGANRKLRDCCYNKQYSNITAVYVGIVHTAVLYHLFVIFMEFRRQKEVCSLKYEVFRNLYSTQSILEWYM